MIYHDIKILLHLNVGPDPQSTAHLCLSHTRMNTVQFWNRRSLLCCGYVKTT